MLQQTTVPTVINNFEGFINIYPSISALSKASEEEILIAWKGLGYYRRAKNLLKAAHYIKDYYKGKIPNEYDQLISIPGIGDYTAKAVLSIGLDQKQLAIDTNLERVLSRYYGLDDEYGIKLKNRIKKDFAERKILNFNLSYRALNEAIMDLGREVCTRSKTFCESCMLAQNCKSIDKPLGRPVISKKAIKKEKHNLKLLRVLIIEDNNILVYKKSHQEWLAGQLECPTFILDSDDKTLEQYPFTTKNQIKYNKLKSYKTVITKYTITNYILNISQKEFEKKFNWDRLLKRISLNKEANLSTATLKALDI